MVRAQPQADRRFSANPQQIPSENGALGCAFGENGARQVVDYVVSGRSAGTAQPLAPTGRLDLGQPAVIAPVHHAGVDKKYIPIVPASALVPAVDHPALAGPADTLQRVMRGLRGVVDSSGGNLVDRHWIRSLRVEDGEADLTLTLSPRSCEGRELAERSFDVMRRLLPDTDVFVHHA